MEYDSQSDGKSICPNYYPFSLIDIPTIKYCTNKKTGDTRYLNHIHISIRQ